MCATYWCIFRNLQDNEVRCVKWIFFLRNSFWHFSGHHDSRVATQCSESRRSEVGMTVVGYLFYINSSKHFSPYMEPRLKYHFIFYWPYISVQFLLISNLTHFIMYLFISLLYVFRANQCSSSGESIVSIHHLKVLVNKQLDVLLNVFIYLFIYLFISLLYMFRATQCSSSGESIVSMHHLKVLVNKQLDVLLNVFIYLFHFSTCFEQPSAHHRENQLYQYIIRQFLLISNLTYFLMYLFIYLFHFSTCFKQASTHHQENQLYQYTIWQFLLISNLTYFLMYLFIYLFHFSTCFEQPSAHHQKSQLYQYIICYVSLCVGDCLICRSGRTGIPGSHLHRVIHSRWCIDTIDFSDDEHWVARNM